jgi:hypothetical protein
MKKNQFILLAIVSLVSGLSFIFIYKMLSKPNEYLVENEVFVGVFDKEFLERELNKNECVGIRFYNTIKKENGRQTVVAVGVNKDLCDLAENESTSYFRSVKLEGNGAIVEPVSKDILLRERAQLDTEKYPKFHISVARDDILRLLGNKNGIGLYFAMTSKGRPTFQVYGGSIAKGSFTRSFYNTIPLSEPCPIVCPRPAFKECYLE